MTKKKKAEVVVPTPGDTVTMHDWLGDWVEITVAAIGESDAYGITIEGKDDEGKFRAFPLSHLVGTGKATNPKRGKWEIEMPNGTVEHAKSKKAAQELCVERGVVFTEVSP